ncbi:MAG: DUF6600 domain-containing protein [Bacteroidota bacterium]
MKKLISLLIVLFLVTAAQFEAKPSSGSFSIGMFYSSLSPYGEWLEIDGGLIVWRPNSVHAHWRPYSIGRWNWTKYGWYWDSYEPFGWATYHYGRWYYDDYYGWIWIPDNVWGPAWVEWRYDNDYIGWAPLPPYAHFRIGFGIYFSLNWSSHHSYWNFVTYRHFHHNRLNYYIIDYSRNYKIFSRTKYRNNYYSDRDRIVNGGIDRSYIERRAGYRIAERNISEVRDLEKYNRSRKSNNDRLYSFRPDEREIENLRDAKNFEVKRADRKSSLDTERIVINNRASKDRENTTDRNNDRNNRVIEKNNRPIESENRNRNRNDYSRNDIMDERKNSSGRDESNYRVEEPRIEKRNYGERKEKSTEMFPKREEVRKNPESSARRENNRGSESRSYRDETPARSKEGSMQNSSSRERKSEERNVERKR